MADELTVTAGVKFAKGTGDAAISLTHSKSVTLDVAGTEVNNNIYSIGTSSEALVLGDVGTAGYVFLRNLDTTNFVTVSADSSAHANPLVTLRPGGIALFQATAAPYLIADTAACRVEAIVVEL